MEYGSGMATATNESSSEGKSGQGPWEDGLGQRKSDKGIAKSSSSSFFK